MEAGKTKTLDEIKENLINFFQKREEVLLAYLFGSCLRNKIGGRHDIDVAIFVNPATFENLDRSQPYGYQAGLTANIIQLLRYNLVDLVILNRATPLLAYEVIHNGILLFSRSEDIRVKFEISSLKRHADTKHLRDIKRIYSEIRTEKGLSAYA
jgi:predicted nucleotidyltransferase